MAEARTRFEWPTDNRITIGIEVRRNGLWMRLSAIADRSDLTQSMLFRLTREDAARLRNQIDMVLTRPAADG